MLWFCMRVMLEPDPLSVRPFGLIVSRVALRLMKLTSHGSAGALAGRVAVRRLPLKAKMVPLSPDTTG
jgi:hypothetical protein